MFLSCLLNTPINVSTLMPLLLAPRSAPYQGLIMSRTTLFLLDVWAECWL
ncbi:hypothetical protein SynSYN20_01310 [Synechococcus sp. SYN20]|nr:hypothetical protein SynSYN20_01310 [Synechococcus sp. SYN20]